MKQFYSLCVRPIFEYASLVWYYKLTGPSNPVWELTNHSKPVEGDLERLFARVKKMDGIDGDKFWSKHPRSKQPKYDGDMKFREALRKLKGIFHVRSCGK